MKRKLFFVSQVSYARNVEHKNQDGVSIRVTEKGTVTTEMVVLGGQNRPSGGMNSGFLRRFELRPCCIIRRHDGVTMEQCKKEEKLASISPLVQNLIKALQDNSRIHAVLGLLRYCGLVRVFCFFFRSFKSVFGFALQKRLRRFHWIRGTRWWRVLNARSNR
jgi:hypothetical protein